MQVNLVNNEYSLLHQFVSELRDISIQHDRARFRKNIFRIGQIMAYEISKTLDWKATTVQTPLGTHQSKRLKSSPILATVLRAGIAMHQGMLDFFDQSDCAFIAAYRKHEDNTADIEIALEYVASPNLDNKDLLLIDPMLATGKSIVKAYDALLKKGTPKYLHIACILGSHEGIAHLQKHLPAQSTLWLAALDDGLNDKGYILPGLGDAGDLSFGEK
jgi:uracil phosphoribosyltransferase